MRPEPIAVVTATVDPARTREFWETWSARQQLQRSVAYYTVINGPAPRSFFGVPDGLTLHMPEVAGVVAPFRLGVGYAAAAGHKIIACLHDDMAFEQYGWDTRLLEFFDQTPDCILAGYGGAYGVGEAGMYAREFDPMTLARHDFVSNMRHAEAHGERCLRAQQVAVLDGFSLIGRPHFVQMGWEHLAKHGVIHHAYDVYFGILAAVLKKQVWMLPEKVHHHGGVTAVGSAAYAAWAAQHGGDQGIWLDAHRKVWEAGKGVLPINVERQPGVEEGQ